jgi:hypothetical protein
MKVFTQGLWSSREQTTVSLVLGNINVRRKLDYIQALIIIASFV